MWRRREGLPCLHSTVHCVCPIAPAPESLGRFLQRFSVPLNDLEIGTSVVASSWPSVWLSWLHLAALPLHRRWDRALPGSSKPQATQGQSSHVTAAPGTKENYLPREANTARAVSRVSIPLFCVVKGPIVETQITQRWHVVSNHLIATGHPLGTDPKLDTVYNPFTGGRQGRLGHKLTFISCSSPSHHGKCTSFEQTENYNHREDARRFGSVCSKQGKGQNRSLVFTWTSFWILPL